MSLVKNMIKLNLKKSKNYCTKTPYPKYLFKLKHRYEQILCKLCEWIKAAGLISDFGIFSCEGTPLIVADQLDHAGVDGFNWH